jgi:hypothetical protein
MSVFIKKNDVLICMQHKSDLLSAIEKQGSAKKNKKNSTIFTLSWRDNKRRETVYK